MLNVEAILNTVTLGLESYVCGEKRAVTTARYIRNLTENSGRIEKQEEEEQQGK